MFWILWILFGVVFAGLTDYREMQQPVPFSQWPSGISLRTLRIFRLIVLAIFGPLVAITGLCLLFREKR